MSDDHRDILQILRYQLNSLEQGGDRPTKEDGRMPSPFRDSQICLNFDDPLRPHACHECFLYDFVPEEVRTENAPCHFIELAPAGHRMIDFLKAGDRLGLERVLKIWLRRTLEEMARGQVHSASR